MATSLQRLGFPTAFYLVVLNTELLILLTGPDGWPLYDLVTKQWDLCYLLPVLQKAIAQGQCRLAQDKRRENSVCSWSLLWMS